MSTVKYYNEEVELAETDSSMFAAIMTEDEQRAYMLRTVRNSLTCRN